MSVFAVPKSIDKSLENTPRNRLNILMVVTFLLNTRLEAYVNIKTEHCALQYLGNSMYRKVV